MYLCDYYDECFLKIFDRKCIKKHIFIKQNTFSERKNI